MSGIPGVATVGAQGRAPGDGAQAVDFAWLEDLGDATQPACTLTELRTRQEPSSRLAPARAGLLAAAGRGRSV